MTELLLLLGSRVLACLGLAGYCFQYCTTKSPYYYCTFSIYYFIDSINKTFS